MPTSSRGYDQNGGQFLTPLLEPIVMPDTVKIKSTVPGVYVQNGSYVLCRRIIGNGYADSFGCIDTIDKEDVETKALEYIDDKRVLPGVCRWRQRPKQHAAPRYSSTSRYRLGTFGTKRLSAAICLMIAVLIANMGMSWSADFQKGLAAAKSGDFATALREWKPLAEQGNADAQSLLGAMYAEGNGVPRDYNAAVKWYRLAAKQGAAYAQGNLGWMYEAGRGVAQDYEAAVKWYTLAAKQGLADAQYNLGLMYENGRGAPQDYKAAVKWYRLAAERGLADAQGNLGVSYAFGTGVLKDYVYAHMWGNIAATNGNELGAKLRDDFQKKMTPAQIDKAQKLARECVRKKYKGC